MAFKIKQLDPTRLLKTKLPNVPSTTGAQQSLADSIKLRQQLLEQGIGDQESLSAGLKEDLAKLIQSGGTEQQDIIKSLRPQLSPLSEAFKTQTATEASRAREEAAKLGADLTNVPTELADRQSAALRQRVLESQPESQQALREALASTGQLRTGRAARGAQDIAIQAQRDIATGQENIQQQSMADQLRARELAYQTNADFLSKELGLNEDAIQKLFASGRQDIIDEVSGLAGEAKSRNEANLSNTESAGLRDIGFKGSRASTLSGLEQERETGVSGLKQQEQQQIFERDIAKANNKQNLRNTLLQGGLQLGTMIATGGLSGAAPAAQGALANKAATTGQAASLAALLKKRQPGSTFQPNRNLSIYGGGQ